MKNDAKDSLDFHNKNLKKHKEKERIAKSKNEEDQGRFLATNHIDTVILKNYNISKSYYHGSDLECEDTRRLMSTGMII